MNNLKIVKIGLEDLRAEGYPFLDTYFNFFKGLGVFYPNEIIFCKAHLSSQRAKEVLFHLLLGLDRQLTSEESRFRDFFS